jgi:tartrate/fumarate subfamily iron-sulfur-dependent hydro-lyase alpha chain
MTQTLGTEIGASAAVYDAVERAAARLYVKALSDIPPDVRQALNRGLEAERAAGQQTATRVMLTIVENIGIADKHNALVCQDTGLPIYKLTIGSRLGVDPAELRRRITRACEQVTRDYPLRSNSVHPLTRKNTGTNTGQGIPVVKFDFDSDSDVIDMQMAPKGSGSENMSFLRMLNPAEGRKGIVKFVLHCVLESGAMPCPPVIVGVGLGGTSDVAAALAKEASCFRKIGSANSDPEVAKLEAELLERINQTGIGPQGLGGVTTAMAVHIEFAHTHISQNPVAVNMQCWRGERAGARIDAAGSIIEEGAVRG